MQVDEEEVAARQRLSRHSSRGSASTAAAAPVAAVPAPAASLAGPSSSGHLAPPSKARAAANDGWGSLDADEDKWEDMDQVWLLFSRLIFIHVRRIFRILGKLLRVS